MSTKLETTLLVTKGFSLSVTRVKATYKASHWNQRPSPSKTKRWHQGHEAMNLRHFSQQQRECKHCEILWLNVFVVGFTNVKTLSFNRWPRVFHYAFDLVDDTL